MFSHKSDEWQTPQQFFNDLQEKYGYFDMDVAATPNNSKCTFFCSKDLADGKDGLTSNWMDNNFCNPPYSMQREFVIKALEEQKKGKQTVMLIPARTDTKLFHDFIYKKIGIEIIFIKGRVKFISPNGGLLRGTKMNGSNDASPFASMVVIFRKPA